MTLHAVKAIVTQALETWRPPIVKPGTTIGIPWTPEQYGPELARLRAALVTPYEQRFALDEMDDPGTSMRER